MRGQDEPTFAAAALEALGGVDVVVDDLSAGRVNDALLPALREAGAGSVIVNISSSAALTLALAHHGAAEAALPESRTTSRRPSPT